MSLSGQVALVTGGGRRIGAAIVRELHAQGMNLAIHCRGSSSEVESLSAQLNSARAGSAVVFCAELGDVSALRTMAAQVQERFGLLDVLVNNASSYFPTPLETLTEAQFEDLVASNLRGPLFLIQACAPRMRDGGRVVNVLDVHARRPIRGFPAYLAAKGGLWTLTESLALELAPRLRVNGVAPGHMIWAEQGQLTPEQQSSELARIPLARLGGGEEVARAVRFLVSEDAAYLNGAVIPVDGGLQLG
jgi:pteridine reductase